MGEIMQGTRDGLRCLVVLVEGEDIDAIVKGDERDRTQGRRRSDGRYQERGQ